VLGEARGYAAAILADDPLARRGIGEGQSGVRRLLATQFDAGFDRGRFPADLALGGAVKSARSALVGIIDASIEGGFQEAAAVVAEHLGFCDVVGGERFLEVGMAPHVLPEVTRALHPDRSLHNIKAEQALGVLFEPVDHELHRLFDLAAQRLLQRLPVNYVAPWEDLGQRLRDT
jgi:hypothetical protein